MQSSRWYVGADLINGFAERQLEGVVFSEMEVEISIGDPVSVTLTGFYGSETPNTSFTPGSQPKVDGTPLIFHGGSIQIRTRRTSPGHRPGRCPFRTAPVRSASGLGNLWLPSRGTSSRHST